MTSSPLKVEDSRAQFEKWFSPQDELMRTNGLGVTSRGRKREAAWYAWQASRWAIEVEIANHTEFEIEHMISPEKDGYSTGWIDGRNYAASQVRAAGITVKGD